MLINKIQYHKVAGQDVFKQEERTGFRVCSGYGIKKPGPHEGGVKLHVFARVSSYDPGC